MMFTEEPFYKLQDQNLTMNLVFRSFVVYNVTGSDSMQVSSVSVKQRRISHKHKKLTKDKKL